MDAFLRRVTLVFTLIRIVMVGVGLQLVPMLLHDGFSPGTAASVAGLLGAAALPGRVVFVPALQRWGATRVTAFLVWVLLLATGLLLLPHHLLEASGAVLAREHDVTHRAILRTGRITPRQAPPLPDNPAP